MNMYYGLSVMALRKDVSADDYSETAIADPETLDFMRRIRIVEDAELESRGPAFRHAARLRVETSDGRAFTREILHRRASPENPVEWEDIARKFNANVGGLLEPAAGERLLQLGSGLERLADVTAINDIVAAPFARG
jgi:2-methylcitrate dehydratase PrpD